VREKVKEHEVLIKHISIELMTEDPMTKALLAKQYKDHVDSIGLANSFDVWLHFLLINCLEIFFMLFLEIKVMFCELFSIFIGIYKVELEWLVGSSFIKFICLLSVVFFRMKCIIIHERKYLIIKYLSPQPEACGKARHILIHKKLAIRFWIFLIFSRDHLHLETPATSSTGACKIHKVSYC